MKVIGMISGTSYDGIDAACCEFTLNGEIITAEVIGFESFPYEKEVHSLIADAMPPRWRGAVLLMASTGLRLGECLGLTVDRIDFLRRTVRIDRQMANTTAGGSFGTPKTNAGVRTIPLPAVGVEMLEAHVAQFPPGEHGLVFTDRRERAITRSSWSDAARTSRSVAPMDTATTFPNRKRWRCERK